MKGSNKKDDQVVDQTDDYVVSDFLKQSSGQSEFKTPDGYFDGFQKNVQDKIHHDKKVWWQLPQIRVAVSGMACIVAIVAIVNNMASTNEVVQNDFSKDELIAYFSDNIDEISENDIIDVMLDADLLEAQGFGEVDSTQVKSKINEEVPTSLYDISDEEIYEYMLDEGYEDGDWDNL